MSDQSPISSVNDFVVRFANVNGSGSASANELFARAILRHGVPVSPRNIFPSNIQGLPTWYEVRVTEEGHLGARGGVDMMVAMNPQTWDKDRRFDRTGRLSVLRLDQAAAAVEIPRRRHRDRCAADRDHQFHLYRSAPAPAVQEHHLSRRTLCLARHGPQADRATDRRAVQRQGKAAVVERPCAASRPRLGAAEPQMPDRAAREKGRQGRRPHLHRGQQRGRVGRGLWRRHRLRLVSDHAVVVAGGRLCQPLQEAAPRSQNPARRNTRSCRARTNSPPSAS